jgi:group I intron endonuclease
MEKIVGIYCVENLVNGKKYIGRTVNYDKRIRDHQNQLKKGINSCGILQKAWDKYREQDFKFYVIEICEREELNKKEKFYIKEWHSHVSEWGYNISWGGNAFMEGRKHTKKTKEKLSKLHIGKKCSEETRSKMSISQRGENNGFFGMRQSEDMKRGLSFLRQGIKRVGNASSQYVGISRVKSGKWMVNVSAEGHRHYLGRFNTENEAATAYNNKIIELIGDAAKLNIIIGDTKKSPQSIQYYEYKANGTSKYYGVRKREYGWESRFTYKAKSINLGTFNTEIEAGIAYNEACLEFYGYRAKINRITEEEIKALWENDI